MAAYFDNVFTREGTRRPEVGNNRFIEDLMSVRIAKLFKVCKTRFELKLAGRELTHQRQ
jgi:hypothetical protein